MKYIFFKLEFKQYRPYACLVPLQTDIDYDLNWTHKLSYVVSSYQMFHIRRSLFVSVHHNY